MPLNTPDRPTAQSLANTPNLPAWQRARAQACAACLLNDRGVCVPYKRDNPTKPCQVVVGIQTPQAVCPRRHYLATRTKCPSCGTALADPAGVTKCTACSWTGDPAVPVPMRKDWAIICPDAKGPDDVPPHLAARRALACTRAQAAAQLPASVRYVFVLPRRVDLPGWGWVTEGLDALAQPDVRKVWLYSRVRAAKPPGAIAAHRDHLLTPDRPTVALPYRLKVYR